MTMRLRLALALSGALLLAGCQEQTVTSTKHLQPIPAKTVALMESKGMRKQDPILVRIYKEESQLEVWKKRQSDGKYALLKTYDICRWSGTLGPKVREGDKQAPEGFYTITPGQMNPKSAYYLSFDLGFPNKFDRAYGRYGAHLMVHGDCLSAGCYAMTDGQIAELYALAREAFSGGQPAFQVQAYPFRMTAKNMARRRDDKNFAFWKNLKEGSDHFEVTGQEPRVEVCNRTYVFNAQARDPGARFEGAGACPAYEVPASVALAVAAKRQQDEHQMASYVAEGLKTASAYIPQDGRMRRSLDEPVNPRTLLAEAETSAPVTPAPAGAVATGRTAQAFASLSGNAAPAAAAPAAAPAVAGAVPMPVPNPYAVRTALAEEQPAQPKLFSWLTGGEAPKPVEPMVAAQPAPVSVAPASRPAAQAQRVAIARQAATPAPQPAAAPAPAPVAQAAPKAEDRPFYRRLFDFGAAGGSAEPQAPAASGPAVPLPMPAPKRDKTAMLSQ